MNKFFVRTTGERKINYNIDYEPLYDYEHKPVESFIKQLKYINDYDAVLLEDDLALCENFKEEIEKVIKLYPNKIINFFTNPTIYFETHSAQGFLYNQCTYYPKGSAKPIAERMESLKNNYLTAGYDVIESMALNNLGIPHIKYRPCLVQHLDIDTLIQDKPSNRRCIYFLDYLKKLNIEYENAFLPENRKKLTKLMDEHIKQQSN